MPGVDILFGIAVVSPSYSEHMSMSGAGLYRQQFDVLMSTFFFDGRMDAGIASQ